MTRHLLTLLSAGLAFALAVPGVVHAQQQEAEEAGRSANRGKPDDRFCIKEVGSRVVAARSGSKRSDEACVNDNGRVYTREEIARTGSVDVKDAVRRLETSGR